MNNTIPWFERKFEFPVPVELLPSLLLRLRETPARLEAAVAGCQPAVLTRKPGGSWSAQEHVGHLFDMEALWLGRLNDFVESKAELTPADLTNRKTHEAGHNSRQIADILRDFRSERNAMLNRISEIDPLTHTISLPHPRLRTPMRLTDHLFFVAEHDDHHLTAIRELIANTAP